MKSLVSASKRFLPWIASCGSRARFGLVLALAAGGAAQAPDNYENQVYGSGPVAPGTLMGETHSNFSAIGSKSLPGSKYTSEGTYPTNHAERETLELTQGLTPWSEVGFYLFTTTNQAE